MEVHRLSRAGTGSFGKHDQRVAGPQGIDRPFDHRVRRHVADVTRSPDDVTREGVREQRSLDDAGRGGRECDDEHDVDQRGVIGNDQLSRTPEALGAPEFVVDAPQAAHRRDKQAKCSLYQRAGAGASPRPARPAAAAATGNTSSPRMSPPMPNSAKQVPVTKIRQKYVCRLTMSRGTPALAAGPCRHPACDDEADRAAMQARSRRVILVPSSTASPDVTEVLAGDARGRRPVRSVDTRSRRPRHMVLDSHHPTTTRLGVEPGFARRHPGRPGTTAQPVAQPWLCGRCACALLGRRRRRPGVAGVARFQRHGQRCFLAR